MKYLVLFLSLVTFYAQAGTTIFVNQSTTNAIQSGSNWPTAYRELRDALNDSRVSAATAANPVEIWVATGLYKPTAGTDRTVSFVLQSHVRLRGGFSGTENSPGDRPFSGAVAMNATVLSGDIGMLQTNGVTTNTPLYELPQLTFNSQDPGYQDNSENVLVGIGVTDVILDGIIVTGGFAEVGTNIVSSAQIGAMSLPNTTSEAGDTLAAIDKRVAGGGLAFFNAPGWFENTNPDLNTKDLTIYNCIFIDNGAQGYGGGMAIREAGVEVDNSSFIENFSDLEGGAFWGQNQLDYFQSCFFSGNWSYRSGGAVHLESIPSLRTLDPLVPDSDFESYYGHSKSDVLATCWSYQGQLNLSFDFLQGDLFNSFTNGLSPAVNGLYADRTDRIISDSRGLGQTLAILAAKKFTTTGAAVGKFVNEELGSVGSGLLKGYSAVGTLITVTDLSFELLSLIPGSADWPGFQTAIQDWTVFYDGFNDYATPVGWLELLYNYLQAQGAPTYEQAAAALRSSDTGYYNTMPNSIFLFCQFETNQTAGEAGAFMDVYDNVHIEDCRFDGNIATVNAGAAAFMGGTSPALVSDSFQGNFSQYGHSAIASAFRVQPHILNCTIVNNGAGNTNGYAIDSEIGADTFIGNCILWGNTNTTAATARGGADLYVPTRSNLDTNGQALYDQAGNSHFDWIGMCDVHFSCIQSQHTTPLGIGDVYLPAGQTVDEIIAYHADLAEADALGDLNYAGLFNVGEGTRPTLVDPNYGNISLNPGLTSDGLTPAPGAPIVNAGYSSLVQHSGTNQYIGDTFNWSITGLDLWGYSRFNGSSITMGAVENQGSQPSFFAVNPFANVPLPLVASTNDLFADLDDHGPEIITNEIVPSPLTNIYVNAAIVGGDGSGSSWTNAMAQIPPAPALATNGTLWIAAGVYHPAGMISLTRGISVYGGFQGIETNVTQSNPALYPTIISGGGVVPQLLESSVNGSNIAVVADITFTAQAVTNLEGVTLDGNVLMHDCVFSNSPGLCLFGAGTNVVITNCVFLDNAANANDSIVLLSPGEVATGCTFSNNLGAVALDQTGVLFTNCSFTHNSGADTTGILLLQGGLAQNCFFSNNTSLAVGLNEGELAGCVFSMNTPGPTASSSALKGYNGTVTNCLFIGNVGLVVDASYSTPVSFANCQFTGNTGVVGNFNGAILQGCQFAGNTSVTAAAIAQFESATVTSTVFSNNVGLAALGIYETVFSGCQFSGNVTNTASAASALQLAQSSVHLSTFTGNSGPTVLASSQSGAGDVLDGCQFTGNVNAWITGDTLVITNCQFANNVPGAGHALCSLANGVLSASSFTGTIGLAAAVTNYSSVTGCTFQGNIASNGASALTLDSGSMVNCAFISNVGPAVSASALNGEVNVTGCQFLGNTNGTPLTSTASMLIIRNSRFDTNSSPNGSGALMARGAASVYIYNSEFWNNTGATNAGAVYDAAGDLSLYNCTLHANALLDATAVGGAGVRFDSAGNGLLANSILTSNVIVGATAITREAQQFAGGIFNGTQFQAMQTFQIQACILQDLTTLAPPFGASSSLDVNPRFISSATGNLQLASNSPAIDRGSAAVPLWLATTNDLAGNPRSMGNGPDIGAYEFQGTPALQVTPVMTLVEQCDGRPIINLLASFSGSTNVTSSSFQWQVNQLDGNGFAPVTASSIYTSVTATNLQITHPPATLSGYVYQLVSLNSSSVAFVSSNLTLPSLRPILYVNQNVNGGTGDGSSWANAMVDLQMALQVSQSCSQIWVAQGTYTPGLVNSAIGFSPGRDVQVYGGFNGTETELSQRDWQANPVILQSSATPTLQLDTPQLDANTLFDGFFIQYSGTQAAAVVTGGPTLRNCVFMNSTATAVILQSTNTALFDGCQFLNGANTAFLNTRGQPVFTNCLFSANQSSSEAGAFQSTFGGTAQFSNCQFVNNSGVTAGAIYVVSGSSATVAGCEFRGNSATAGAGALQISSGAQAIVGNSLLVSNTAVGNNNGGAISDYGTQLKVAYCTIADNSGLFGALDLENSGWTVDSTIFWGNTGAASPELSQIHNTSSETLAGHVTYSLVQGTAGDSNYVGNLSFYPLFANEAGGDYHLLSAYSPVVSRGNPAVGAYTTDLDGHPRPENGGNPEIGCYSFVGSASPVTLQLYSLPASQGVCSLQPATFAVSGLSVTTNLFRFDWQEFNGTGYTNIISSADQTIIQSGTTNSLVIANPADANGALFQLSIDSGLMTIPFQLTALTPQTIYVNANAPSGGDGLSWATALNSLSQALGMGASCVQIWVAQGTYTADLLPNGQNPALLSGVEILGGFNGTETNASQRDPVQNFTQIISGSGQYLFVAGAGMGAADQSAILDGFHLTSYTGAGLYVSDAGPLIRNCTFENNAAAVSANQATGLRFENCVFQQNADSSLEFQLCTNLQFVSCQFSNNYALSANAIMLLSQGANPLFTNCAFAINGGTPLELDSINGGAALNCSFITNTADPAGAALYLNGDTFGLTNCQFLGNSVVSALGSISSTLSVSRSIFSGNSAPQAAAINVTGGTLNLRDSLIAGNVNTTGGGAITVSSANVNLLNDTIADNSGNNGGDGLLALGGSLAARNCIFWGNTDAMPYLTAELDQIDAVNFVPAISYSAVQGLNRWQDANHDNMAYDPIFVDEPSGNYQLAPISPAIGTGSLTNITSTDVDLLGNPREHGLAVDRGAYAFVGSPDQAADLIWDFSSRSVCAGVGTSFSVSNAAPAALTHGWSTTVSWYVNTGGGFVPISNDANYTVTDITNGAVTIGSTLTLSTLDPSMDNDQFQFVLSGAANYTSAPITISVASRPIIYVDAAAQGTGDGSSWANAYTQLSPALANVSSCAAIWMAAGDYPQTNVLTLPPGVEIDGGFPSGGAWADRNPLVYQTYLEPAGSTNAEVFQLQTAEAAGQHTLISGLSFRNGASAVVCLAGSPSIRDCRFENFTNTAFVVQAAEPDFTNCVFAGNAGGILGAVASTLGVTQCTFSNNTAPAIESLDGEVDITGSTFSQNTSAADGAAVYLFDSGAFCSRDIFAGNVASLGGAIYVDELSSLALTDSLLDHNTAGFEGGAIANYGDTEIVFSTIADNSANYGGGAFVLGAGNLSFANSISWNNLSTDNHLPTPSAAEMYLTGGALVATNSILDFTQNVSGVNLIAYNPLFTLSSPGDYTLTPRSPAIEQGNQNFIQLGELDLAGNPRVQNSPTDMGAYQSGDVWNPIQLLTLPESVSACLGQPVQFIISGAQANGYQWRYNLGGGWTNLADGDTFLGSPVSVSYAYGTNPVDSVSTLTISATTAAMSGALFDVTLGSFTTAPVTLAVATNNVIYVDASAPAGGDGTSWATAYNSVLDALNASSACLPNIRVAQGVYSPIATHAGSYNYYHDFYIPAGITVLGGFPTGGGDLSVRDPNAYPTILRNPGVTNGFVVQFNGSLTEPTDTNTVLDGFTIQGGAGLTGVDINNFGPLLRHLTVEFCGNSGLIVQSSTARIENSRFLQNSNDIGGGVAVISASPTFINCTFQGNTASDSGGGIYVQSGDPQLLDVLVTGNSAPIGGGIFAYGPVTVINGTIAGNRASTYGGGVAAEGNSIFSLTNSIVWGNRCDAASVSGGGVVVGGATYIPLISLEAQQLTALGGSTFALANTTVYGLATLTGSSVLGLDPVFSTPLDAGDAPSTNGDFHLGLCSPLRNFGSSSAASAILSDLDGQPRLIAGQVDAGPYEAGAATATSLVFTSQPQDLTYAAEASSNVFSVTATGDAIAYQWQMALPGAPFVPLTDGSSFSGSRTPTLSLLNVSPALSGSLVRCVATSAEGCMAISSEAHLTIQPSRYYVNASQPDDSGDGTTWATAFKTIGHALASTVDPSGAQIWIAAGSYVGGSLHTGDLLYGGFHGGETNLSQRNWTTNLTIILPATTNAYVPGGNPYAVMTFDVLPQLNVLSDGTVTNQSVVLARIDGCRLGNANTVLYNEPGAQNITVANCVFTNCDLGIWNLSAAGLEVTNTLFLNTPVGVHFTQGGRLDNSTFVSNGIGAWLDSGSTTVAGCLFASNHIGVETEASGSAPTLGVFDSSFVGNWLGMFCNNGSYTLQRCDFRNNGAGASMSGIFGGGINLQGTYGSVEVDDSVFSDNVSLNEGAGVFNSAMDGVTFRNCTFAANQNTAIYSRVGSVNLYNCILWGNVDASLAPYWWSSSSGAYSNSFYAQVYGTVDTQSNNVIQNGTVSIDPGFVAPMAGDYHLTPCSQILALGSPSLIGSSLTDLDGQPRLFNGTVTPGAYQPASDLLLFSTQPTNIVGLANQSITFVAAVAQTSGVTYQWQVSTAGSSFLDLSNAAPYAGVTTPQLSFTATSAQNGHAYRLSAIYPSGCSLLSQAASFTLYTPTVIFSGPVNGILQLPSTNFTIGMADGLNAATLNDESVAIFGSESGRLNVGASVNGHPGEEFSVTVDSGLMSSSGFSAAPYTWQFTADVTSWDGNFAPATPITTTASANTLASGDLNRDGSVDLFVSTTAGCRVLTNSGAGHFVDSGQTIGSGPATKIVLADVGTSGALDALILRNGAIEVWTNSGAGVFGLKSTYASVNVTDFAAGDFNNDGAEDLFVLTADDNRVWWNDGSGNLNDSGIRLASTNGSSVAVGDFNEDGWLDACVVHSDGTSGQLWVNHNGTFTAGSTVSGFQHVSSADVTGDGHLDLLTVSGAGNVSVLQGNGAGSFVSYWTAPGTNAAALVTGDINGDHRLDLILPDASGDLAVYASQAGGFTSMSHQGALNPAQAATLADFDGDGALDLVTISTAGQLNIALYQPTQLYGSENVYPFFDLRDDLQIDPNTFDDQFATRYAHSLQTITIVSVPTNGYLVRGGNEVVSAGETFDEFSLFSSPLTYLGKQNSSGRDSFTWSGADASGAEPTLFHFNATIAPTTLVNAVNDYAAVGQGGTTSLLTNGTASVLLNDTDNDGNPLTAALASAPAHGSVQVHADGTFTYTHDGSYTHADSFTYSALDQAGGVSATAYVYITITNVNHTPTAINLTQNSLYEGQPAGTVIGQLSTVDPDPQNSPNYTYTLVSGAGDTDNAAFTINGSTLETATPLHYADGATRSIRVRTTDAGGAIYETSFSMVVFPLPQAIAQSLQTAENGPGAAITLPASGKTPLTYVIVTPPTNGVLFGAAPNVVYQPATNFFGADSFTFQVTDGVMTSAVATVSITVNFVDQPPAVTNMTLTTAENVPLNLTLFAQAFLPGETLSYQVNASYLSGTLSGTAPHLTYTPAADFHGAAFFTFTASENGLTSSVANVFINVSHVNQPPLAISQSGQVQENGSTVVYLEGSDPDYDPLSYRIVTPPQHGSATGIIPGAQSQLPMAVTYRPAQNYSGTDTFTYVANDGQLDSAPATFTLTVTAIPTPTAPDITASTIESEPVDITLLSSNVAAGFTNLATSFRLIDYPAHGQVADNVTNPAVITYTPAPLFYGTDTFTYVTTVGGYDSTNGTVQIAVLPLPPIAESFTVTNYGNTLQVALQGSDPAGLPFSYTILSGPTNGTITTNLPFITYTPNTNFWGTDTVTYDAYDSRGASAVATVTFMNIEPEHPPVAGSINTNSFLGIPLTIPVTNFSSDPAGDPLTLVSVDPPGSGYVTISNNCIIYTATNLDQYDSFSYTISNNFDVATGFISVQILDRHILVGDTNYPYIDGNLAYTVTTLEEAVAFANSFGPTLPWTISSDQTSPSATPIVLTDPTAITPNGDLSALDITGNIVINSLDDGPVLDISAVPGQTSLRLFQVESGARLRLENCFVSGGTATEGGAIYNEGTLELYDTTLATNAATAFDSEAGLGGAIFSLNGDVAITNCVLSENSADVGGAFYQLGDGTNASLNVSNCVMTDNASVSDFYSTNSNGGSSAITATTLTVDHPTMPWFGPLAASYTVRQDFSATFPVMADSSQYGFTVTPAAPWNDSSQLIIAGGGSERTLTLSPSELSDQPAQNISVTLSNGNSSYTENFSLAVDSTVQQPPIAMPDIVAAEPLGSSVTIPVLANDINLNGPHSDLRIVSVSRASMGTVSIVGTNIIYRNTTYLGNTDTFTYVVTADGLSAIGTVTVNLYNNYNPEITTSADSGPYTLRADLDFIGQNYQPGGYDLVLEPGIDNSVLTVSTADDQSEGPSAFVIAQDVTIDGSQIPGATLQLDPNAAPMRFFHVLPGATLTLKGLTLSGGSSTTSSYGPGAGGAIYNEGTIDLEDVTIANCNATGSTNAPGLGGAIYNLGSVILNNTLLSSNTAYNGGGIYQFANASTASVVMTNSTLQNPASTYDIAGTSLDGGLVSVLVSGSVIQNPAFPWVGQMPDLYVQGTNTVSIRVGQGTNIVQVTASSDNPSVVPTSNLTVTGTNELRQLSILPVENGIAGILVQATVPGYSFARTFTLGVTGAEDNDPIVPDYHLTTYLGGTVVLPVLTNVINSGDAPLQIMSASSAASGSVVVTNNEIVYVNDGGSGTNDFFSYVVTNTFGGAASGRVFVTIVPATVTITNTAEFGPGSLGDALTMIRDAGGNWTVLIDPSLAGQTVALSQYVVGQSGDYTAFDITDHVRIDGSNAPGFTIAAQYMRAFRVDTNGFLELLNLQVTGGTAYGDPGNLVFATAGMGGAVANLGTFYANNVLFDNNIAEGAAGGAILNNGGNATIVRSTFQQNQVMGATDNWPIALPPSLGGAIFNYNGSLLLVSNSFSGNTATLGACVYNAGNAATAKLRLIAEGMTNSVGIADLSAGAINGGNSLITSFETNVMTVDHPFISGIASQVISGPTNITFAFGSVSNDAILTAISSNPSVLPNSGLVLSTNGAIGNLMLTPNANAGTAQVTLQSMEGGLTFAEIFDVAVLGAPQPLTETFETTADQPITFNVLSNYVNTGIFITSSNLTHVRGQISGIPGGDFSFNPGHVYDQIAPGVLITNVFTCELANASAETATLTVFLVVQGVAHPNTPPVTHDILALRQPGASVQIPLSVILAAATDPNQGEIYFYSSDNTSANGASITQTNNGLLYTPLAGNNAADSFHFTIFNSHGVMSMGSVLVQVVSNNFTVINPGATMAPNVFPAVTFGATESIFKIGSDFVIQFIGIPNQTYSVEYSDDLANWTTAGSSTADASGILLIRDVAPTDAQRYYRVIPLGY